MDTEVDGHRYLLLRIPNPGRNRIQLSPREQEIVRMVAKGHPNKIIADVLNISSWTVCTHLRRLFAKLGVGSRAAMVAYSNQSIEESSAATDNSALSRSPFSSGTQFFKAEELILGTVGILCQTQPASFGDPDAADRQPKAESALDRIQLNDVG